MDLPTATQHLASGEDLSRESMKSVMRSIMSGQATDAQIGAFLTALMIKGETVDEISGAAQIMRELSSPVTTVHERVVDCVGTGGDKAGIFNVSTASTLVAAAGGAVMAKHGNRAATGNSGSAELLACAGVDISLSPEQVGKCIDRCGIGFLFAPTHHSAMRHAMGPRKEIGIRTVFNLLGPLTNPAQARYQLAGVFSQDYVRSMARVYAELGSVHTLVASSDDGLDEISIAAPTLIAEFHRDEFSEYTITPEQFGIRRSSLDALVIANPQESLDMITEALSGKKGPAYDMVSLNAGATIYAGDLVGTISEGVDRAREILDKGSGIDRLADLVKVSNSLAGEDA